MEEDSGQDQLNGQLEKPINFEGSSILGKQELKKEEKVVIHTMPKRFISTSIGSNKAKNVGILIMVGGTIFLIVIAVFLYFFLLKPQEEQAALTVKNSEKATEEPETKTNEKTETEIAPVIEKEEKIVTIEDLNSKEKPEIEEKKEIVLEKEIEEATSSPEIKTEESKEPSFKQALDSDKDGLSDVEERLFGTIINLKDSDSDGYDDLAEILALYNPVGEGSIMVNPNIEKYTNSKYKYSLYYLKKQEIEKVGGGDESIMFKMEKGHFIQVVVEENSENLSIEEWYKKQFNIQLIKNEQRVYKKGWTGIKSEDGLAAYLAHPINNNIYIISYNPGTDYLLTYKNVFELMINSLEIK